MLAFDQDAPGVPTDGEWRGGKDIENRTSQDRHGWIATFARHPRQWTVTRHHPRYPTRSNSAAPWLSTPSLPHHFLEALFSGSFLGALMFLCIAHLIAGVMFPR